MKKTLSTLELTQALIRCPSVTPNDAGCQAILIEQLAQIGFSITELPSASVSNFYAQHGQGEPFLGFAGHTDVVPTGDLNAWRYDPFTPMIEDEWLYGRGAQDMKGGVAAMVTACARFVQTHPAHEGSLALLITSAEEGQHYRDGTPFIVDYLTEQGITLNWCIVGEPSSTKQVGDVVRNGRRGSLKGYLTVHGVQGHVAYPELAKNPIHLCVPPLAEMINTHWDQGNDDFPPTTVQCSNINAGTQAANVIPGDLSLWFSFRYSPETTGEAIQEQVANIFAQHQVAHTLTWDHSGRPFFTPQGHLTQTVAKAIAQITGSPPTFSTAGGTSDGRFIAPTGAQVIELGVCNDRIHQVNERVRISELDNLSMIYMQIMQDLL